jgi:hypothetical protein
MQLQELEVQMVVATLMIRAATVVAAILACESGGCGYGRDFIRTKTAWLRLDATGCLNNIGLNNATYAKLVKPLLMNIFS